MTSRTVGIVALTALALVIVAPAHSQSVKVSAHAAPAAKAVRRAVVKIVIPSGYHVYGPKEQMGIPTSIAVKGPKGITAKVLYPKATAYQSRAGVQQVYSGTATVPVELRAAKGIKGKQKVEFEVRTQMCNDRICLPPATALVTVTVVF